MRQGLSREDLCTIVVEHLMADTARHADVVLPSTTQFEHFDVVGAWGHHYVPVNELTIAPRGEALSHGETMRRVAARPGLSDPVFSETDVAIAASALPSGVSRDRLRADGRVNAPAPPTDPCARAPLRPVRSASGLHPSRAEGWAGQGRLPGLE